MQQKDSQNTQWKDTIQRKLDQQKLNEDKKEDNKKNPSQFQFDQTVIKAKFKKSFRGQKMYNLINPWKYLMSKENWLIVLKKNYHQFLWSQIFQNMTEAYITKLKISVVQNTRILKEISHIKFTYLQTIDLRDNLIGNIEAFSFLDIPQLKYAYFLRNSIRSLKPLNKFKGYSIERLHFSVKQFQFIDIGRIYLGPLPFTIELSFQKSFEEFWMHRKMINWEKQQNDYLGRNFNK